MIPRLRRAGPIGSRSGVIVSLLLVTLAVSIAIGWEARRAAAAERRTAEGVLRDYAGFAAAQYVRAASGELHKAAELTIGHVTCATTRNVLATALEPIPPKTCDCGLPIGPLRTVFAPGGDGVWAAAGEPLDDAVRTLVLDDLQRGDSAPVQIRAIDIGGRPSVVAWRVNRSSRQLAGAIVADVSALEPVLARALTSPLLPATLLSADEASDVLALRVTAPNGASVYANQVPASDFAASARFGSDAGGLVASASLTPEAAQKLIIGGLPRSRMPLVYGLTALCVVLITLAGIQLTREAALARLRTDFVAGVSHELRTPLTQIRMFAETIALGRVRNADEHRESLNVIVRESQRLSHLVDKVLSFARIERGSTLDRRDIDLSALIRETTEAFTPVAAARHARLDVRVEPGLRLHGEAASIGQVLLNLLDNAVKYGREGQVVRVTAAHTTGGTLITVDDEGPGVPDKDRRRIWQPFWRAAGSEQGGSGIGLAIVEQVVTLHEGRAWVERADGGGARFLVLLPGAGAAETQATLEAARRTA
ncbi:MAG: HAMP domain-containing sensor histidine kinase [Vicinamibacterales bacterium]